MPLPYNDCLRSQQPYSATYRTTPTDYSVDLVGRVASAHRYHDYPHHERNKQWSQYLKRPQAARMKSADLYKYKKYLLRYRRPSLYLPTRLEIAFGSTRDPTALPIIYAANHEDLMR